MIGPQGKNFELSVAVTAAAHDDLSDQNVDVATFNVESASFLLNGQMVQYVANGILEFDDNWSGLLDFIVFGGEFMHLGQTVEIASVVVFPTTTFQFTHVEEPPPFFASIANLDQSVYGGRTYTAIVPAGNLIEVVPEPGLLPLVALAALSVISRRTRSRFGS